MPKQFKLRTYQRVQLCGTVYYLSEDFLGKGTVWDLSAGGWRIQGDHQVRVGLPLHPTDGASWREVAAGDRASYRSMGQRKRFWCPDQEDPPHVGEETGTSYRTSFCMLPQIDG